MSTFNCRIKDLKKLAVQSGDYIVIKDKPKKIYPLEFNPFYPRVDKIWTNFLTRHANLCFWITFHEYFSECDSRLEILAWDQNKMIPNFISDGWITSRKTLKRIIINQNTKYVDLSFCSNLEIADIPESVTVKSFSGCEKLRTVKIPPVIKDIPSEYFNHCTSLESVEFSSPVVSIGRSAFRGCNSLTKISIPEGCKEIGWNCFTECKNLEEVILPSTLEIIWWDAFKGCSKLKNLRIPKGCTVK